jgi:hypothetical protein
MTDTHATPTLATGGVSKPAKGAASDIKPLLEISVSPELSVSASVSGYVVGPVLLAGLVALAWRWWASRDWLGTFEVDQAEIGLGSSKLKLAVNETDRQIAYKIWVELSTRKIGLDIDLEHDVIVEVYDSWHTFFTVTRELIKDVPVSKFRRAETEQIVRMSIEVLNFGLRPHLTKWQARFRRWYEWHSRQDDFAQTTPQEIQKKFPDFDALSTELREVNGRLISYRQKMYELVVAKR